MTQPTPDPAECVVGQLVPRLAAEQPEWMADLRARMTRDLLYTIVTGGGLPTALPTEEHLKCNAFGAHSSPAEVAADAWEAVEVVIRCPYRPAGEVTA